MGMFVHVVDMILVVMKTNHPYIALGFIYENFDTNDVAIFNNIDNIMDNVKYLEFEI